MFGRLLSCVASGMVVALVAAPALADYGNKVNTACTVDVTAKAGKPVTAVIDVQSNAGDPIHGTVTVTVFRGRGTAPTGTARAARAAAGGVWSTSARYTGKRLVLTGPVLARGSYHAVASFAADPGVYLGCRCFSRFHTASVGGQTGDHNGGGLPNTGGPSVWWLVLGGVLVLGGGSTLVASRRRH